MEELLIVLLKSSRNLFEGYKSNSNNARLEEIIEKFNRLRHKFRRPKLIGKKLYRISKNDNPSRLEKEEAKKYLTELEEELNKREKYNDHDDPDYYGIRDIENLFNKIDEDYLKPIKVRDAFNGNYIEYESRGNKNKTLSFNEYLYMIIPYLKDLINDHKANGEWKIQLSIQTNFISSIDSGETRVIHSWSKNVEVIMDNKRDDIINTLIDSLRQEKRVCF